MGNTLSCVEFGSRVLLPSIEQRSILARSRPRPSTNHPGMLISLPDELIMLILNDLLAGGHLAAILSWSYTCRRHYHISPIRIEDLFERKFTADIAAEHIRQREGKVWLGIYSGSDWLQQKPSCPTECVKCPRRWYHKQRFSIAAIRSLASERQCIGHKGQLWLCPFKIWGYHECMDFVQNPHKYRPVLPRIPGQALQWGFPYGPCECGKHVTWVDWEFIERWYPIAVFDQLRPITKTAITEELSKFRTSICPHVGVQDDIVLDTLDLAHDPAKTRLTYCPHQDCRHFFSLNLQISSTGKTVLHLKVGWPVGWMENVGEGQHRSLWQTPVVSSAEVANLKVASSSYAVSELVWAEFINVSGLLVKAKLDQHLSTIISRYGKLTIDQ